MKAVTLGENNPVNPDPENPVDPENPNPENNELVLSATTDETTITVSWKPVENASEYEVFWKEKGANGDEEKSGKFASSSRDTVSHVINDCEIGKTYAVRVIAYMSEGAEKEASIDVTVREALTPLPDAVIRDKFTHWTLDAHGNLLLHMDVIYNRPNGVSSQIEGKGAFGETVKVDGAYFEYIVECESGARYTNIIAVKSGGGLAYWFEFDLTGLPNEACTVYLRPVADSAIQAQGYDTPSKWTSVRLEKAGSQVSPGGGTITYWDIKDPSDFAIKFN